MESEPPRRRDGCLRLVFRWRLRAIAVAVAYSTAGLILVGCEVIGGMNERVLQEPLPPGSRDDAGQVEPSEEGSYEAEAATVVNVSTSSGGGGALASGPGIGGQHSVRVGEPLVGGSRSSVGGREMDSKTTSTDSALAPVDSGQTVSARGATTVGSPADCDPSGIEDCADGIDNNCDGLIDCADPVCRGAGYGCVGLAADWVGPVAVWTGTPGSAPDCAQDRRVALSSVYKDLKASPVTCGCSCGAADSQSCGSATVDLFSNDACGNLCATVTAGPRTCSAISRRSSCGAAFTATTTIPVPKGGSCAPALEQSVPAATWGLELKACSPLDSGHGQGCSEVDGRCSLTRPPEAPFQSRLCVYQIGDPPASSCPAGFANGPLVFYSTMRDTRACTGCSCGAPSGGTCSGTIAVHSSAACEGKAELLTLAAGCQGLLLETGTPTSVTGDFVVNQPGTCSVQSEAEPVGDVQGTGAVTVCCAL